VGRRLGKFCVLRDGIATIVLRQMQHAILRKPNRDTCQIKRGAMFRGANRMLARRTRGYQFTEKYIIIIVIFFYAYCVFPRKHITFTTPCSNGDLILGTKKYHVNPIET